MKLAIAFVVSLALLATCARVNAQVPDSYTLAVSPQEADLIGDALSQQPWAKVNALVAKLLAQINEQKEAVRKAAIKPAPEPAK